MLEPWRRGRRGVGDRGLRGDRTAHRASAPGTYHPTRTRWPWSARGSRAARPGTVEGAQLEMLQLLVDRGRSIGEEHTRKISELPPPPPPHSPLSAAAGRGRGPVPVPRPQPLRLLDWDRPDRRLVRRPRPTPALSWREPADQPGAAHHGHRPAAHPDRGPRLLRPEEGRREDLDGSDALPQTAPVRPRLPDHARRPSPDDRHGDRQVTGPGGHRGNDSDSSATGSQPHTGSSDKPLPDPSATQRKRPCRPRLDTEGSHLRTLSTFETRWVR